jgi:hypothetical protein
MKRGITLAKLLRLLGIAFVVLGPTAVILGPCVDQWSYQLVTPLSRSERDTRLVLNRYERTGEAAPAVRWIAARRGRPHDYRVMSALGTWGISHPRQWMLLTEQLPAGEQRAFVDRFSAAVSENGLYSDFHTTFSDYRGEVLDQVWRRLYKRDHQ